MIEIRNVSKSFGSLKALDNVSAVITEGSVFGLVGTNGAGKSTMIRVLSGILKPEDGEVLIDGETYEQNELIKKNVFYISDEQFFFPNSTPNDMRKFYERVYEGFDRDRFDSFMGKFGLDKHRKIHTFSKGMKKQVSVILGICSNTKYLLCDETFDGLDPVMRQAVKSIFIAEMGERDMTPIIASHNLRELEDICDHVGLLHRGGILFSKELDELKDNLHKVQCVFQYESEKIDTELHKELDITKTDRRGSLITYTVRGEKENIQRTIQSHCPLFMEMLPLSLEEIFISETEVVGYDIKDLIY